MKRKYLFVLLVLLYHATDAQLKHYITYNAVVYGDFFNAEKDKSFFPKSILSPSISYKIERKKMGVEVFYIGDYNGPYYFRETFSPQYVQSGIQQIIASNIGIAVHYNVLDKKYVKINPFSGLIKNWYRATIIKGWYNGSGWNEPALGLNKESQIGLLLGANINVPIYEGAYINSNARYLWFPSAQFNKQNLIFEIGVGYLYQNKKKDKSKK